MDIRWLGHSCFELRHGDTTLLLDPFLTGNPKAAASPDEVEPDAILLTHGHGDHFGDVEAIARRTGAPVVAITEVADELQETLGEDHQVFDPNLGGTVRFAWGSVRLVPAWHTALTPRGTPHAPAGLVVELGGTRLYHLGDTALFSDLALVGRRGPIDVALVPIGGHYTMDRWDAVHAVQLVGARTVIPCHFGTFPPIETDAQAFRQEVEALGAAQVVVLEPGGSHTA